MKSKPNTNQFKQKKDPSIFLEGGAADAADRTGKPQQETAKPNISDSQQITKARVHREQKIFRLPLDLINALKRESYERSIETGSRVTETEIVEQAIRKLIEI